MNKEDEIIKWFKAMQAGYNLLVEAYRHKELWETETNAKKEHYTEELKTELRCTNEQLYQATELGPSFPRKA